MDNWLVWLTGSETPIEHLAGAAFVLPGGFLAFGDDSEPGAFRPTVIFAPGAWTRAYQTPVPSVKGKEAQGQ